MQKDKLGFEYSLHGNILRTKFAPSFKHFRHIIRMPHLSITPFNSSFWQAHNKALQKCTYQFHDVCLSYVTIQQQVNRISYNFIIGNFTKIY
jgi:hypothetical protein